MSNFSRKDIYNEIHEQETTLNEIKSKENEEKKQEDIEKYFSFDEQIDLATKSIEITIAKKYKIDTGRHPLGKNKEPTKIFLKWVKTNFPNELESLQEMKDIQEALEGYHTGGGLTGSVIKKIKRVRKG